MNVDRAQLNAERATQLQAAADEELRERWRDGIRTALECVGSCLLGVFFIGASFYVSDYQLGLVYFWSGLIVGYSLMIASLAGFYRRGEARGQW